MNFRPASFEAHVVHIRSHQLNAVPMWAREIRCETVAEYLQEVESVALICHDDGYPVAGFATTPDVHLFIWIFLIAMQDGISYRFANRQLDIELRSRNTLRSLNQLHEAVHERRDRSNFAGHPEIDFQDGTARALYASLWLRIRRPIQASHSIHGKCLTARRNALRGPKCAALRSLRNVLICIEMATGKSVR